MSESSEIHDKELLIRRVSKVHFHFLREDNAVVSSPAFKPIVESDNPENLDKDGISLYRCCCLRDPHDILTRVQHRLSDFGLVFISVEALRSIGLTVDSSPDPPGDPNRIPGHVVIPELNVANYKSDKNLATDRMLELASKCYPYLAAPAAIDGPLASPSVDRIRREEQLKRLKNVRIIEIAGTRPKCIHLTEFAKLKGSR